ncbi:hypothetical protein NDK47_12845 [Brevibacillus ruminantium]|uniref:Ribbon-helix-helix protein CopG domain-containing protein n=1 Tax=Brevibacillus ruminantium TaxID=2950604 RepID=A0ABY4WQG2_9BACL|nr:hypothetical protein [Brevibacillus ruminantium]USG68110.1 hypothetical protein NDK47_12845 [Brevibacillus ruminantium]
METASLMLTNTFENQEVSRQIRDFHKKKGQPLTVRFSEELTHIVLEAACLYLPSRKALGKEAQIEGVLKKNGTHYEIHPRSKGKTINLHLDSELVAELEQIRTKVSSKTQHEVILEMFIRGLRAYQQERDSETTPENPN